MKCPRGIACSRTGKQQNKKRSKGTAAPVLGAAVPFCLGLIYSRSPAGQRPVLHSCADSGYAASEEGTAGCIPAGQTSVFRRADHAPCGLQYLVHAGIAVGIIKSKAVLCVIITAQHFLLRIYLRQAHTHNGAPDQAAACKINSLTKDAAHHAKTQKCFGRVRHKLRRHVHRCSPEHCGRTRAEPVLH